jgi:hypothetical protein
LQSSPKSTHRVCEHILGLCTRDQTNDPQINNLLLLHRDRLSAAQDRAARTEAFKSWAEISFIAALARSHLWAWSPPHAPSRLQLHKLTAPRLAIFRTAAGALR